MNAYVRQGQVGTDTPSPMTFGYEVVLPVLAVKWLRKIGIDEVFIDKDKVIVKYSSRNKDDAETIASLWNSRN